MAKRPDRPDTRNTKARLKAQRMEDHRLYLSEHNGIKQVIDRIVKIENEGVTMEAQELQANKIALDARLKLLNKQMPDLKAVEISQDPDSDGFILKVERVVVDAKPAD